MYTSFSIYLGLHQDSDNFWSKGVTPLRVFRLVITVVFNFSKGVFEGPNFLCLGLYQDRDSFLEAVVLHHFRVYCSMAKCQQLLLPVSDKCQQVSNYYYLCLTNVNRLVLWQNANSNYLYLCLTNVNKLLMITTCVWQMSTGQFSGKMPAIYTTCVWQMSTG